MKIPQRLQIFTAPTEVVITDKDAERLAPFLTNWMKLHHFFLKGTNIVDLRRLIVMELMGSQRKDILTRLSGRLATLQRKELQKRIRDARA